jgi:hypothetical protein
MQQFEHLREEKRERDSMLSSDNTAMKESTVKTKGEHFQRRGKYR